MSNSGTDGFEALRTGVRIAINPCLAVGLCAFDGADVVRLAEVVPGADLDEGNLVAVSDKSLPAGHPEVLITIEHELSSETSALNW